MAGRKKGGKADTSGEDPCAHDALFAATTFLSAVEKRCEDHNDASEPIWQTFLLGLYAIGELVAHIPAETADDRAMVEGIRLWAEDACETVALGLSPEMRKIIVAAQEDALALLRARE